MKNDFACIFDTSKDRFIELQEAIEYIEMTDVDSDEAKVWPTLGDLLSIEAKYATNANWNSALKLLSKNMQIYLIFSENSTILDKFNYQIKQNELYSKDSETIDGLIHEMATRKITSVGE